MKVLHLNIIVTVCIQTTFLCAKRHSVKCCDENSEKNITTHLPCSAQQWCSPQWNRDKTEKTPPKPRLHKIRYYVYKINGSKQHNIGLKIRWSNIVSHYQNYIHGYSLIMYTSGMMHDFRICFELNKTENMKNRTANGTIEFQYRYKCEEGCVKIGPGKTYLIEITPNPMIVYQKKDKVMHQRRRITIPGCENKLIRKVEGCRLNGKKTKRKNSSISYTRKSTTLSNLIQEDMEEKNSNSKKITRKKEYNSYHIVILTLTVSGTAILVVFVLWIVARSDNPKAVKTQQKTILFLEKIDNSNSLHSLASQWLVSEIKAQGHIKVIYSKWEMLKLVKGPAVWLNNKIEEADAIVLLFASRETPSQDKMNDTLLSTMNIGNWLEKRFLEIAEDIYWQKKLFQATFCDKKHFVHHTKIKTYQLMEEWKEFYTAICGNMQSSLPLDKKHRLHKLARTIKKLQVLMPTAENKITHTKKGFTEIMKFIDDNDQQYIRDGGARRKQY